MKGNNVYLAGLVICIIMITSVLGNQQEKPKEIIVIAKEAEVKKAADGRSEKIAVVPFGTVMVIRDDGTIKNNMIPIEVNAVRGWVRIEDTSYIPQGWVLFKEIPGIEISLPGDQKFTFLKNDGLVGGGKGDMGEFYEDRLYNKRFFIVVLRNFFSLKDYINKRYKSEGKKLIGITYSNQKGYYYRGIVIEAETDTQIYTYIIEGKKDNKFYEISVLLPYKNNVECEDDIIAKKIIFSMRVR